MSTSGPKDCRFDVSGVGIERLGGEDADARRDRFVGLALERLEKGLKDHLSAIAGNGHADLLANGLLGASEDEVVGEGLQTCTLAIGKRTGLLPMIDVSAAATGARDRVGGLRGVEPAVDNDTNKLSLYYKDCWAEFLDRAPSSFFMYIAGGFDGKDAASVLNTLERCTQKYGRPVCAITVNAMLRLVRMNNRPGPEALVRAFSQRAYYPSAESIIRASA